VRGSVRECCITRSRTGPQRSGLRYSQIATAALSAGSAIARTGLTVVSSSRSERSSPHRSVRRRPQLLHAVVAATTARLSRKGGGRWQAAHTFPALVRGAPPAICCPGNAETLREPKVRISCRAT
jgi:hypothetical protein